MRKTNQTDVSVTDLQQPDDILTSDTFETWKKKVEAETAPDEIEKPERCPTLFKYLGSISHIKIKHSGIWNN